MDKAYMLASKLINWCSGFEFAPQLNEVFDARLAAGTTSEAELSVLADTQAVHIRRLKTQVPDIFGMSTGPFIISPKMRAFLDDHEQGTHRYFPIQIITTTPKDSVTQHGTHWLLFPPPRIDCLNFDFTIFTDDAQDKAWSRDRSDASPWGNGPRSDRSRPPRRCVLDGIDLKGRHLWRVATGNDPIYSEYVCSPEFWSFYLRSKMMGWETETTCDVL